MCFLFVIPPRHARIHRLATVNLYSGCKTKIDIESPSSLVLVSLPHRATERKLESHDAPLKTTIPLPRYTVRGLCVCKRFTLKCCKPFTGSDYTAMFSKIVRGDASCLLNIFVSFDSRCKLSTNCQRKILFFFCQSLFFNCLFIYLFFCEKIANRF